MTRQLGHTRYPQQACSAGQDLTGTRHERSHCTPTNRELIIRVKLRGVLLKLYSLCLYKFFSDISLIVLEEWLINEKNRSVGTLAVKPQLDESL